MAKKKDDLVFEAQMKNAHNAKERAIAGKADDRKQVRYVIGMTESMDARIEAAASERGWHKSQIIRSAIEEYLA